MSGRLNNASMSAVSDTEPVIQPTSAMALGSAALASAASAMAEVVAGLIGQALGDTRPTGSWCSDDVAARLNLLKLYRPDAPQTSNKKSPP